LHVRQNHGGLQKGAGGFIAHRVNSADKVLTLFAGLWDHLKLQDRGRELDDIAAHAARAVQKGERVTETPARNDTC
jgi:hypothetical protein